MKVTTDIDLAKMKLSIDRVIEPSTDVEGTLRTIDSMVEQIKTMLREGDSSMVKMLTLKKYLYHKGDWNQYTSLINTILMIPLGTKIENKLLSTYLKTKKGNCVTMPLLFVILGERIGT